MATSTTSDVVSNKSASTGKPIWPNLSDDHALHQFHKRLPGILSGADYNEVWGIELSAASPPDFDTLKILQKFLRANQNNLDKGAEQLENTLKWRKEFKPREQLEKLFSERKYKGLGYITKVMVPVPGGEPVEKVICWNVYGDVANIKETFGDLEDFMNFRVALMELTIQNLGIATGTQAIPDYNPSEFTQDPYQAIQIHDYKGISFLRPDPLVKAASSKTIDLFSKYYPELLEKKYFVNVPWIMEKFFATFKLFLPAATIKKFVLLNKGMDLVKNLGSGIPAEYGGTTDPLLIVGQSVKLGEVEAPAAEEVVPELVPAETPVAPAPVAEEKAEDKKEEKTEEKTEEKPTATAPVAPAPTAAPAVQADGPSDVVPEATAPVPAPAAATDVAPKEGETTKA